MTRDELADQITEERLARIEAQQQAVHSERDAADLLMLVKDCQASIGEVERVLYVLYREKGSKGRAFYAAWQQVQRLAYRLERVA